MNSSTSQYRAGADLGGKIAILPSIGKNSHTANGQRRHLLMLGGGAMQLPAIRMAREEGWFVIVADGNPGVPGRDMADAFEHVDLKDKDRMLEMAAVYHANGRLHAVFTAATDFSATVAWVAEHLGLPGIPYEVALNASDKLRMRTIFEAHDIPSPRFVELSPGSLPGDGLLDRLEFPLVVKPVNNMGARGVSRVDGPETLSDAIDNARNHARGSSVIIEEFISGSEYSIDSLVTGGKLTPCGIALRHIYFPPYFVEMGHTLPSDLSARDEARLVEVFSKAVAALGIQTGAAKGDVFFGPKGPVIGEIAARLSGGYMSGWTFPLASGVEVTRAALYIAMGLEPPSLAWKLKRVSAERAMISIPGILASVEGLEAARELYKPDEVFFRVKPGDAISFPKNNVEKAANVIAAADEETWAKERAESVVKSCLLKLVPGEPRTAAYLFRPLSGGAASGGEILPEAFPAYVAAFSEAVKQIDLPELSDENRPRAGNSHREFADLRNMFDAPSLTLKEKTDWSWRTVEDSIGLLETRLSGFGLSRAGGFSIDDLAFWLSLFRGGAQLSSWLVESLEIPSIAGTLRRATAVFVRSLK